MLQEGSVSTSQCLSLLKACHSVKALHRVHHLHNHIVCHGLLVAGLLGDYLIVTYAKCGALDDAFLISSTVPYRTVFSWSAIISANADCGRSHEALQFYQCMENEGIQPNDYTFVSLLKACANTGNLEQGRKLHCSACVAGFTSDPFVANTLVSMYGKCGWTKEAEDVFQGLLQCEVVSWTAMISAYVEVGLVEEAFLSYRQMQEENISPNRSTFVILLQACCCLADREKDPGVHCNLSIVMSLEIGEACHVDAQRMGFISDVLLLNTLVTMYSKCGAIPQAEAMFDCLCNPHIVSWNAILSAYVQQGEARRALLLYGRMLNKGITPELHTVVFVLQACSILACNENHLLVEEITAMDIALGIGVCLHADAFRMGYAADAFVGTALLSMYGKLGKVSSAEKAFAAILHHDLASCNAMLTMYSEQGEGSLALRLFREMCEEGMSPNTLTFVACLQGCESLKAEENSVEQETVPIKAMLLEIVRALHSNAFSKGIASDVLVANTLITAYGKLGAVDEVQGVFYALSERTVVSWTAVISILIELSQGHKALQLFRQMQEENTCPNELTYASAFQACACLGDFGDNAEDCTSFNAEVLEIGRALHKDAWRDGFELNPLVNSALVTMYGKCGSFFDAEIVFSSIPCLHIDTCNAMISLSIAYGEGEKALWLYRIMQQELVPYNQTTFINILLACSEAAYSEICYELHFHILSLEFDWIPSMNAALIDAYARSASMAEAQDVFENQPKLQVGSWRSCIAGYSGTGNPVATLRINENLKLEGYTSDLSTLTSLLAVCSRAGFVSDGLEYFLYTREENGPAIELHQFSLMLDIVGRAGDFNRVSNLLLNMQPDLGEWSCVLGFCRLHSHIVLAKFAFERIVSLQNQRVAPFVLMRNIYADAELRHLAEIVELDS